MLCTARCSRMVIRGESLLPPSLSVCLILPECSCLLSEGTENPLDSVVAPPFEALAWRSSLSLSASDSLVYHSSSSDIASWKRARRALCAASNNSCRSKLMIDDFPEPDGPAKTLVRFLSASRTCTEANKYKGARGEHACVFNA
jgi:hypothetical protein